MFTINKKIIFVIEVVVCIVIISAIWSIVGRSENKNVSADGNNNTEAVDDIKPIEKPTEDSLNINEITGFSNQISATVTENIDTSNNEQGDNQEVNSSNSQQETVDIGITLPFTVPGTSMEVLSVGQYTGPFIEDGSDAPSGNILSIVVKNNSDEMLQYGEVHLKINDNETAIFKLSSLPAKTSALVIESTGVIEFSKDNKYEFVDSMYASLSEVSLIADKIEVKAGDNEITIKNISGEDLGTVYVYYKYIQEGGVYLGGITYRTKFENVTAGAEINMKTSHFSKTTSEILMVDYIK